MKYIIGIDEAGRGPLAGPVTVGAFLVRLENGNQKERMEKWLLRNIFGNKLRDSKKLSPKKREEIYKKFLILKKAGKIFFTVSHISNKVIDKNGISFAIKKGISDSLKKLHHTLQNSKGTFDIRLDGLLKAPEEFKNQKTIIKGDEKDVFIACASIVAKVTRDRLICRLSSKYPHYAFEIHKGYGTKLHYSLIKKHGISPLHRKSFCKKF